MAMGIGISTSSQDAADVKKVASFFTKRAPAEDLVHYAPDVMQRSAALALRALKQHRRGTALVSIDHDPLLQRAGKAVTAITIVNDNMPFLFDSITGEISDAVGEASLVLHPVLLVRHDENGVVELIGESVPGEGEADADKISLIHVHVGRLGEQAVEALKARLQSVVAQVRAAVSDWKPMLARLDGAIQDLRTKPVPFDDKTITEAVAFLDWLRDDNFTFLGMREFRYVGGEETGGLERADKPGIGILADANVRVLRRDNEPGVATSPELRAFLHGPDLLLVTKANAKSVVHRRIYLDYIGVKTFNDAGQLTGELRIVGLFTMTAYTESVMEIPYLRSKVEAVFATSGFDPHDHSGKALINVLESYPRDELFQISVPTLRKHAEAILALGERPRVRALVRVDQFDRFVSVIVFVPKDNYDSVVREKIGAYLKQIFDGRLSAYYPAYPEGSLARVHFIIGRSGGPTPKVDVSEIETNLRALVRTWEDELREAAADAQASGALVAIASRLPKSYQNSFTPQTGLADAGNIATIGSTNPIAVDFYFDAGQDGTSASLKIYHHGEPVALSRRVPLLENMGFRVISERTFEIPGLDENGSVFIHDMELESGLGKPIDLSDGGALVRDVFLSIWRGETDNDGYAALVQSAFLRPQEIQLLRAYGRYLQQAGIPQSQDFIAGVLNKHAMIARALFDLFAARFDPAMAGDDAVTARHIKASIKDGLDAVPNLDEDTILRRFENLIEATLRTNYFAVSDDEPRSLALKFESHAISWLPEPRPWREIFVYGPQVEGVHLRFGAVARGGLRWSDRAQDYRTEVLGLVKAQQVKNAVIVPVGAKGGFFPRRLPSGGGRAEIFEAGRAAYINFISSMLSITDNLDGDRVLHPADVKRHDGDDPYFVVAADKGTATFSDTANAISQRHDFWLDDAFASGGSAGYDHKKMAITARGAWEAVKRHFREMNRDIMREPFTVVGVGDMSGDVFGNGMLLSPCIRLVAAFDHRDIFIDPTPNEVTTFAERKRLFDNPQLTWQDFDKELLSEGGMVVSRAAKSITLSAQAAAAIGLSELTVSPAQIMSAILKAPVDLLWFGGIGTYVRGVGEANADVGDRANDAIRITGRQIRAKVVGEGANLGMTQRGRIDYGISGGHGNSDAIDNSAGVNSSDIEVNIKIALAGVMRRGALTRPSRDHLLADMTEEVAKLVLQNNYLQTLAISMTHRRGAKAMAQQERLMQALESRGLLDRVVEVLPSSAEMKEREARDEALTRPEIAVLMAYAKLVLFDDLIASQLPDDPHLEADLMAYFPSEMTSSYADDIRQHRLRREIIATMLANDVINRGGPTFINRMQDLTGRTAGDVVAAFVVVREGYDLPDLYRKIDALDGVVSGDLQLELYGIIDSLIVSVTLWLLKNDSAGNSLDHRIEALRSARAALEPKLRSMLPDQTQQQLAEQALELLEAGTPEELARELAFLSVAELVPDIARVAEVANTDPVEAAGAFFAVSETFRMGRIFDAARAITPSDYYDGLALARANAMLDAAQRGVAVAALARHRGDADPVQSWVSAGGDRVARVRQQLQALTEGGDISVSRLTVASGLMNDLS